jgi:hypothetical protein
MSPEEKQTVWKGGKGSSFLALNINKKTFKMTWIPNQHFSIPPCHPGNFWLCGNILYNILGTTALISVTGGSILLFMVGIQLAESYEYLSIFL